MNIFVLSKNPTKAAEFLCDKHVVKMTLETAQLLCSVYDEAPYKRTHYNHPCSIWARKSKKNYQWLLNHGAALAREYKIRYGKTHKSSNVILWCELHKNDLIFNKYERTNFALAMPAIYKSIDPVSSYRSYYLNEKRHIATWNKKRRPPYWWPKNLA